MSRQGQRSCRLSRCREERHDRCDDQTPRDHCRWRTPGRAVLEKLLRTFLDVEVLGKAENGPAAIDLIEHADPDLALIDLQMPGLDGLAVAKKFKGYERCTPARFFLRINCRRRNGN